MKSIFTILFILVFTYQAGGFPFPPGKASLIEGTVSRYVWMSASEYEAASADDRDAESLGPKYVLCIKNTNIDHEKRRYLTLCTSCYRLRHPIIQAEKLEKDEMLILVPSEHLKELRIGSKVSVVDYEIFRDDFGCSSSIKEFRVDGKAPTKSGGPFKQSSEMPVQNPSSSEQSGADQSATQPADKAPEKNQPPTPTSKDGPQ